MKQPKITALLVILFLIGSIVTSSAQHEETGMPGDNFSLEGALQLFKKAKSLENFEELLNTENNEVNNLDMNEDGETDFIKVIAQQEENAHAITLQVPISKNESQDIAVIAIEKTDDENATLQIIGDEEVYGEELIVEPYDIEATSQGKGPNAEYELARVVVNVWYWPSVRWVYRPAYRVYVSPWYWGYYPKWWRPWRPVRWSIYGPRYRTWSIGFRITPTIRVTNARRIYTPRRTTSVTVVNRYRVNKTAYIGKKKTTVVKTNNRTKVSRTNEKVAVKKSNTKHSVTNSKKKATVTKTKKSKVKNSAAGKTKKVKVKKAKVKKKR